MDSNPLSKGIFLLVLAVSGNFVAETLGCKTQKLLSQNMFAKHIVIILITYFAIDFTSGESNKPSDTIILSFLIYALFILFTKMSIEFTIIVFTLLTITYVITNYINYYKENDKDNSIIETLEQVIKYLYIAIISLVFIGFGLYLVKQRSAHYKSWSTIKFLFGTAKCNSLK